MEAVLGGLGSHPQPGVRHVLYLGDPPTTECTHGPSGLSCRLVSTCPHCPRRRASEHDAAIRPARVAGGLLIAAGGLIYSAGAAVYALRRPDPAPAVFGYHEVFHLLVIAGVAAHLLAISLFALPPARSQLVGG